MKAFLLSVLLLIASISKLSAQAVSTWSINGPVQFPVNVSGQVDGMGRVTQVKFHPTDTAKMYATSASGGLYISSNNGYTWTVTPGTDKMPASSCGAVCIDYTNDSIIYLGTGDPDYYSNSHGVWKSTDGGLNFSAANTGIGNALSVEILMDPLNHVNLVSATNNGIWKTTNSAGSWTQKQTGAFKDMKARPGSNKVLYAVTATQFYYSTDFGDTWINTPITAPASNTGIRIAVSAADTNVVYLVTTKGFGWILKSIDGGASFNTVFSSTTKCIVCYDSTVSSGSQGDYNIGICANPSNANEVLVVAHDVWRSIDGGLNWSMRTQWYDQCHTDMHQILFNPYNPRQVFNANDGGVWMTTDSVKTYWVPRSTGLSSTEIYHAAQSPISRDVVAIGTQDNGELYTDGQWKCDRGGDWSPRGAFDYRNGDNVWWFGNGNRRKLSPLGGLGGYGSPFPATNPSAIGFSPTAVNAAFLAKDTVWRSTDISASTPTWTKIYPSGEGVLGISVSPADSDIVYVLTKNNHVFRTDDAFDPTPTFTVLTTPAATNIIGSIAASSNDTNKVYLTCGPKIYFSHDKGVTWTDISGTLPATNIIKVLHDNYSPLERIFVQTGSNVYYKDSTTTTWTPCTGLPSIAVFTDFMIYNDGTAKSVLRLSTYGRGVWEVGINNDHTPIVDFNADKRYLCPGDTVRYSTTAFGAPTSYSWSFPGGSPSTSTAANPVVVYNTAGSFSATLTASNAAGADTVMKTTYITVSNGTTSTLSENFESAAFPPTNWRSVSQSGLSWSQQSGVGGFGTSNHAIMFDNFNNDVGGVHDKMISPGVDLDTSKNIFATFDLAYSYTPDYNDSLMVQVSADCGHTWTPVYVRSGDSLATAPSASIIFTPTSTQWRKDTINLNAYAGSTIMLSFENIGHFGNALYLDNVNVYFTRTVGVNEISSASADIQVYPNPSSGIVNITGKNLMNGSATINCYNIIGTLLTQKQVSVSNSNLNTRLDLSGLPKGVYEIRLQQNNGMGFVKKLVLE